MPEFLDLLSPSEALDRLIAQTRKLPEVEEIETKFAYNRITSSDVTAPYSLPSFRRSTVDGYAVRAGDTHGASETLPVYLSLIGEVEMGIATQLTLSDAECALIHTGGMLPTGADAVVMLEDTQVVQSEQIEVMRSVADAENILQVGEDVKSGEVVLSSGSLLRPADIGGLLGLGITHLEVAKQPVVGIISTGDEVVAPENNLLPGQVRDINSYTLNTLVEQAGVIPHMYGIVPDDEEALHSLASQSLQECDMVVITAGSSASARDLTARVINRLGKSSIICHGLNIRPGKPTILATCVPDGGEFAKPIIGLPGNPVSALVIAILFVEPVIDALQGLQSPCIRPYVQAQLSINLSSQAGREDWVPVRLLPGSEGYLADPIFGKSNLIFILSRADGLLKIPPEATGLSTGEIVEVMLL
jgi:molybdopterin molybdotransferase